MAFLESVLAAAATKAGIAVLGVTAVTGGAGVAAATGNLPQDLQVQVDELFQSENANERAEQARLEAEARNEAGADNASDVSKAVRGVVENRESYETGREFGEAVSNAARSANGSAGRGQGEARRAEAEARRAEAQQRRADRQANAGTADDAAAVPEDAAERRAEGEANAGSGDVEQRPEGAGAPEGAGSQRDDA